MLCDHTNLYGWLQVLTKPSYADKDGGWDDVDAEEMYRFLGLIIFMGIVKVSSLHKYWSTSSLYHGLWARHFMSRDRFKALLGMLHVTDPAHVDDGDKLRKIRPLLEYIRSKCQDLYQAKVNVAVDERMVKSKGRSGIRQCVFQCVYWATRECDTSWTSLRRCSIGL